MVNFCSRPYARVAAAHYKKNPRAIYGPDFVEKRTGVPRWNRADADEVDVALTPRQCQGGFGRFQISSQP